MQGLNKMAGKEPSIEASEQLWKVLCVHADVVHRRVYRHGYEGQQCWDGFVVS